MPGVECSYQAAVARMLRQAQHEDEDYILSLSKDEARLTRFRKDPSVATFGVHATAGEIRAR